MKAINEEKAIKKDRMKEVRKNRRNGGQGM